MLLRRSYSLQIGALFEGGVDDRQLRTVQLDDLPSLQSHHDYPCGLRGSPILLSEDKEVMKTSGHWAEAIFKFKGKTVAHHTTTVTRATKGNAAEAILIIFVQVGVYVNVLFTAQPAAAICSS